MWFGSFTRIFECKQLKCNIFHLNLPAVNDNVNVGKPC